MADDAAFPTRQRADDAAPPTRHRPPSTPTHGAAPSTKRLNRETVERVGVRRSLLRLPDELVEDYAVEGSIGGGGQAQVLKCRRLKDDHEVAIKVYLNAPDLLESNMLKLLEDAEAAHVVPLFKDGSDGENSWEVMEYFPLGTLHDLMVARPGPWEIAEVELVFDELASALNHAHQFLLHRDLKPANVFVRKVEPLDLVIGDFGSARKLELSRVVATVVGTTYYMAPEGNYGDASTKIDWWSLGVMIHQLLTGRHMLSDPSDPGTLMAEGDALAAVGRGTYSVDDIADDRWRLLVRGLTTYRMEHRWGSHEVGIWRDGGSPQVHTDAPRVGRQSSVLFMLGKAHRTVYDVAATLRERAVDAAEYLTSTERRELQQWLAANGVGDNVRPIFAELSSRHPRPERAVVELQLTLDPDNPVAFRGRLVTAESLATVIDEAFRGSSAAQDWIDSLVEQRTLHLIASYRPERAALAAAEDRYQAWLPKYEGCFASLTTTDEREVRKGVQRPGRAELLACALDETARRDFVNRASAMANDGDLPANLTRGNETSVPEAVATALVVPAWQALQQARRDAERERQEERDRKRMAEEAAAQRAKIAEERAARIRRMQSQIRPRIVWSAWLFGALGVVVHFLFGVESGATAAYVASSVVAVVGLMSLIDVVFPMRVLKALSYYGAIWGGLIGAVRELGRFPWGDGVGVDIMRLFVVPVSLAVIAYAATLLLLLLLAPLRSRDSISAWQSTAAFLASSIGLVNFVLFPLGMLDWIPAEFYGRLDFITRLEMLDATQWTWLLIGALVILVPVGGRSGQFPKWAAKSVAFMTWLAVFVLLWSYPILLLLLLPAGAAAAIVGALINWMAGVNE